MKIAVAGTGYVGLSNAILLAQHHEVIALDIDTEKVDMINRGQSPLADYEIETFLATKDLDLTATTDPKQAFKGATYVIISTPTNYDPHTEWFDTNSVETVIEHVMTWNTEATMIIKSTVPIGYTKAMNKRFHTQNILFSPEFLREGKALYDNLHPSRIIVGEKSKRAKQFANLLAEAAIKKDIPMVFTDSTEAETIKLVTNTYLAMRVSFFNEIDTYAELKGLDTKQIVKGVSYDPRIGDYYNNPSFGYGGYCLPKDTKQVLATFKEIPSDMIRATVTANDTRKEHIAHMISLSRPDVVGIYRLTMKTGSDNFRESAIQGVIDNLKERGKTIVIYEPVLEAEEFDKSRVYKDLDAFKNDSDVIVANRLDNELMDVRDKVYTRDLFSRD